MTPFLRRLGSGSRANLAVSLDPFILSGSRTDPLNLELNALTCFPPLVRPDPPMTILRAIGHIVDTYRWV